MGKLRRFLGLLATFIVFIFSANTAFAGYVCEDITLVYSSCKAGYYLEDTNCKACPKGFTSDDDAQGINACYKEIILYKNEATGTLTTSSKATGTNIGAKVIADYTDRALLHVYYGPNYFPVVSGLTAPDGYTLTGGIGDSKDCDNVASDTSHSSQVSSGTIIPSTMYVCKKGATVTCSAGEYLPANTMECESCLAGYKCPSTSQTYQKSTSNQGLTACSGTNEWQELKGQTFCDLVPDGYLKDGNSAIQACGTDGYCKNGERTECHSGSTTNGVTTASDKSACVCKAGYSHRIGGNAAVYCDKCIPGTYKSSVGDRDCTVATSGYYVNEFGQTAQKSCSATTDEVYTKSDAKSDSINDCYRDCKTTDVANSGAVSGRFYYGATAPSSCAATKCEADNYLEGGVCTPCPPDYPNHDADSNGIAYCYKECGTNADGFAQTGNDYHSADDTCVVKSLTTVVTFDTNGGTFEGDIEGEELGKYDLDYGEKPRSINELGQVYRLGYWLEGWYDDKSGGKKYYNADGSPAVDAWDKMGAEDTLYAHWIEYTCSVSFDCGDGTSKEYDYEIGNPLPGVSDVCVPPTGYKYNTDTDGKSTWNNYTDATYTVKKGEQMSGTTPYCNENTSAYYLQATYAPIKYNVTYSAGEGGTGYPPISPKTCEYDAECAAPENNAGPDGKGYTRQGYTFTGWKCSGGIKGNCNGTGLLQPGDNLGNATTTDDDTITLTAQWAGKCSAVALDNTTNGGSGGVSTIYYRVGETSFFEDATCTTTIDKLTSLPKKNKYVFIGYTHENAESIVIPADGSLLTVEGRNSWNADVVKLYAKYAECECQTADNVTCSVTGTNDSNQCVYHMTCESGYNSGGKDAFDDTGEVANPTYEPSSCSDGNSIRIIYKDKAGNESGSVTCEYGQSVTLKSALTTTGYQFSKWKINGTEYAAGAPVTCNWVTSGSVDANSVWTANTYDVRYVANGGVGDSVYQDRSYDDGVALIANPFTRTGYTFVNWNTVADGTGTTWTDKATGNLTDKNIATVALYAQWEPNTYTVKYNANGGTGTMADQKFTYDQLGKLSANEFSNGLYQFVGWKLGSVTYSAGDQVRNLTAEPNGVVTLDAQWGSECLCTKGEGIETCTPKAIMGVCQAATATAADGYTAASCTVPVMGVSMCTAVIQSCTVKYYCGDEQSDVIPSETFNATTTIQEPNYVCQMTGYTVEKYFTDINSGETYYADDELICESNDKVYTLKAEKIANKYTISFDLNDGEAGKPGDLEVEYDGELPVISTAVPTRTGYTFDGWADANGTKYYDSSNQGLRKYQYDGDITLYAQWVANKIKLSWQNGGHGIAPTSPAECTYDKEFNMPAALTANGYTFDKWNVNNKSFNAEQTVKCNIDNLGVADNGATATITASWTDNTCTISYDCGEGNGSKEVSFDVSTTLEKSSSVCSRNGYTSDSWIYDSRDVPDTNTTTLTCTTSGTKFEYTARWKGNTINLIWGNGLNSNEDVDVPSNRPTTCTYGGTFNVPSDAMIFPGHTHTAWKTKTGMTLTLGQQAQCDYDTLGVYSGETEINGAWNTKTFTVKYDSNSSDETPGVAPTSPTSCTYGDSTCKAPKNTFINTGLSFAGWNTAADGTGTSYRPGDDISRAVTEGTLTLYAQWGNCPEGYYCPNDSAEPVFCPQGTYTEAGVIKDQTDCKLNITLNYNGGAGTCAETVVCNYNKECQLPTWDSSECNISNGNKVFVGWAIQQNATTGTFQVTNTQPTTMFAVWSSCSCTNGSNVNACTVTGSANNACQYNFTCNTGYNYSGSGTGTFSGNAGVAANTSYNCNANSCYVKYDCDTERTGSTGGDDWDFDVSEGLPLAFEVCNIHAGWNDTDYWDRYTDDTYTQLETSRYANEEDTLICEHDGDTFYLRAEQTPLEYTVTYSCGDGTGTAPAATKELYSIDCEPAANTCSRAGYTFGGWSVSGTSDVRPAGERFEWRYTENKTFTAKWNLAGDSTITYHVNDGTMPSNPVTSCNAETETFNLPTPTRTGYTFGGWYDNDEFTNAPVSNEITKGTCTSDMELWANWLPNEYTVTYSCGDGTGTAPAQATATYDDNFTPPAANTCSREGYTFGGWSVSGTSDVRAAGTAFKWEYTEDKTFTAKWNLAGDSTITYHVNDGTMPSNPVTSCNAETETFNLPQPTRTGYTFDGWYDNDEFTNAPVSNEITKGTCTSDMELWANWLPNEYTVTYSCGDGTGTAPAQATATYDDNFTPAANTCSRTGYKFDGWTISGTSDVKSADVAFKWQYTEDKTFTATWKPIVHTVKLTGASEDPRTLYQKYGTGWSWTNFGDKITEIGVPQQENKVFRGYYTNPMSGNDVDGTRIIDADGKLPASTTFETSGETTLYAAFSECNCGDNTDCSVASVNDNTCKFKVSCSNGYNVGGDKEQFFDGIKNEFEATNVPECRANVYTIRFDKNNSAATGSMADQEYTYGSGEALARNEFELKNHKFLGWSTTANGTVEYLDEAFLSADLTEINGYTVTLYAVWEVAMVQCQFGQTQEGIECPVGSYCPGGTVDPDKVDDTVEGCVRTCPNGGTTDGGATAITDCYKTDADCTDMVDNATAATGKCSYDTNKTTYSNCTSCVVTECKEPYIPNDANNACVVDPAACQPGYWCDDAGSHECPAEFPLSEPGATSEGECYKECSTPCVVPDNCPANMSKCVYDTTISFDGREYNNTGTCLALTQDNKCKIDLEALDAKNQCNVSYYMTEDEPYCKPCDSLENWIGAKANPQSFNPRLSRGATACYANIEPSCNFAASVVLGKDGIPTGETKNYCPENAVCTEGQKPSAANVWYPSNTGIPTTFCSFTYVCNPGYKASITGAVEYWFKKSATTGKLSEATVIAACNPETYTITLNSTLGTGGTDTIYQTYKTGWFVDENTEQSLDRIETPELAYWTFRGYYTSPVADATAKQIITEDGAIADMAEPLFVENTTLYAWWTQNTIDCRAGEYYFGQAEEFATCPKNEYCPGEGEATIGNGKQCSIACPDSGLTDDTGNNDITACYKTFEEGDTAGDGEVKNLENGEATWKCNWLGTLDSGAYANCQMTINSCDGGYYVAAGTQACSQVESGMFSPDGDKDASKCDSNDGYFIGSDNGRDEKSDCYTQCDTVIPTVDNSVNGGVSVNPDSSKQYWNGTEYGTCLYNVDCKTGYTAVNGAVPACNANEYTVTFDVNGGNGTVESINCTFDSGVCALPAMNTLSRDGYVAANEWCTSSENNGSGTCYAAGQNFDGNISDTGDDVTLYAKWEPGVFEITLDTPDVDGLTPENATQGPVYLKYTVGWFADADAETALRNLTELGNNLPQLTGYTFNGYSINGTAIIDGSGKMLDTKTIVTSNATAEAQWSEASIECEAGKYYPGTGNICVVCEKDHYCAGVVAGVNGGMVGLSECQDGGQTSGKGAESAKECFKEGMAYKTDYASGTQTCYFETIGYTNCTWDGYVDTVEIQKCVGGYWFNASASRTDCVAVGENFYSPADDMMRTECPDGGNTNGATTSSAVTNCIKNVDYVSGTGYARGTYDCFAREVGNSVVYDDKCKTDTIDITWCAGGYWFDASASRTDCVAVGENNYSPEGSLERSECPHGGTTTQTTAATPNGICRKTTAYPGLDYTGEPVHGSGNQGCFYDANSDGKMFGDKKSDGYTMNCDDVNITTCDAGYYWTRSENTASTDTVCVPVGKDYFGPIAATGSSNMIARDKCPNNGSTDDQLSPNATYCYVTDVECSVGAATGKHAMCNWNTDKSDYSDCTVCVLEGCPAGTALNAEKNTCDECAAGAYCPGGNLPPVSCADNGDRFKQSKPGAVTADQCFDDCASTDMDNAENVSGIIYRGGNNPNQCVIEQCTDTFYLDNNKCVLCAENKFCDGENQTTCPKAYPHADAGNNSEDMCFADCTMTDNATAMTGRDFYGDDVTDTCAATACVAGYFIQNGVCTQCPAGKVCNPDVNNGQPQTCSDLTNGKFPMSAAGTANVDECYRACVPADMSNAANVTGNMYSDGTNACTITKCADTFYLDNNACTTCPENSVCNPDVNNGQPQTCSDLTNGKFPMSAAGTVNADECYRACVPADMSNAANVTGNMYSDGTNACTITKCADTFYLDNNACVLCPEGGVCNPDVNNGKPQTCSDLTDGKFPMSAAGTVNVDECYRACVPADMSNAANVTGNVYSDGTNACTITKCADTFYLNNNACTTCPENSVCNPDVNNGQPQTCSDLTDGKFPMSAAGTVNVDKCYRACVPADMSNAANVTGNMYSDGTNACVVSMCGAGYYLTEGNTCVLCPEGSVCNPDVNNGKPQTCSDLTNGKFPMSAAGTVNVDECYRACVPADMSNAANVTGNMYSDGTNACTITKCTDIFYLNNNACVLCPADSVCDGVKQESCPDAYPYADAGNNSVDMCYRGCIASDMNNATSVTGKLFSDGTNACEIKVCDSAFYLDNNVCVLCEKGKFCDPNVNGGLPVDCPVTHPNSDAGSISDADCFAICEEDIVDNGIGTPVDEIVMYPNQCEYTYKTPQGNPCDVIDGICYEKSCVPQYEMIRGKCTPCDREHALSYKPIGNCIVAECADGYHPNGQECEVNVVACDAPNAISAEQVWNANKNAFGECIITECDDGFHLAANSCQPDEQVCAIENGIGMREWNHKANAWGDCKATKCDPGYTDDPSMSGEKWKQCGRCNNMYGADGDVAASSYVDGCEIASCMYQGEKYILEGNECVLICNNYSDETGSRYWDDSRKKCVHECTNGYTQW